MFEMFTTHKTLTQMANSVKCLLLCTAFASFLSAIPFIIFRNARHDATLLTRSTNKSTSTLPNCSAQQGLYRSRHFENTDLAPCGEVCTYEGQVLVTGDTVAPYPELYKNIDCENIIRRMAFRNHSVSPEPPVFPPADLLPEFTMFGDMPILMYDYYLGAEKHSDFKDFHAVFTSHQIDELASRVRRGENVNPYENGQCVQETLSRFPEAISGKRCLVLGTIEPWLEAILIAYGASHVTTLEYGDIRFDDPRFDSYTPYEFAERYLKGDAQKFDCSVSFSSLEHAGLGRYTDPLNPYGDLEAMAQVWCLTKPGGTMAVGVRSDHGKNYIIWNIDRVYGEARLQQLTANWRVLDVSECDPHVFVVGKRIDE